MLAAAFVLLGTGMIAVFEPAVADPFFRAVQLQNHQVEIGSVFIVLAISIFTNDHLKNRPIMQTGIGRHIACFNNVSEATGQLEFDSQRGVKIDRT